MLVALLVPTDRAVNRSVIGWIFGCAVSLRALVDSSIKPIDEPSRADLKRIADA